MFTFASNLFLKTFMNKFLVSCTIALTILVSACQKESLQDGSLQSQSEVTDKSQLTKETQPYLQSINNSSDGTTELTS
nr:hypothetical protein [uncultured Prevotella sp.]